MYQWNHQGLLIRLYEGPRHYGKIHAYICSDNPSLLEAIVQLNNLDGHIEERHNTIRKPLFWIRKNR
jgi:hypothetical protein